MTEQRYRLILGAIIVIGCIRIGLTWPVFSQIIDEPAHIAAGMQWLDAPPYRVDLAHPPLGRVAGAIGPFLAGARYSKNANFMDVGMDVLYRNRGYRQMLSLARMGTLPFFILAAIVTASWARRLFGDAAGLAAALLLTNEPNMLAHSGLATNDAAATATTIAAAYAVDRWLATLALSGAPKLRLVTSALTAGAALALALLAKMSALLFVPVAVLPVLASRVMAVFSLRAWKRVAALVAVILGAGLLVLWAGYRFSFDSVREVRRQLGYGDAPTPLFETIADVSVPAPELLAGIASVAEHNSSGHVSYLFGRFSDRGWWYYFPVAVAVKTTFGLLLLACIGLAVVARSLWRERRWAGLVSPAFAPLAAGLLILLASLRVHINIGVRHVLPMYPFLAIAAGAAVAILWKSNHRGRIAGAVLVSAALASSLLAHPDYLPYFNALGGREPGRILTDSNLDWGQDLLRLAATARRRDIHRLALAYSGTADPRMHIDADVVGLEPRRYTPGWVAVSDMARRGGDSAYDWLDVFHPVERVGKSIVLYQLPSVEQLDGTRTLESDEFSRVVVPVWLGAQSTAGAWSSNLVLRNDGDASIAVRGRAYSGGSPLVVVPPRSQVRNPPLPVTGNHGQLLYVDRSQRHSLHLGLSMRSPAGGDVAIPVAWDDEFRAEALEFLDLEVGQNAQVILQIYNLDTGEVGGVVEAFDAASNAPLGDAEFVMFRRDPPTTFPAVGRENLAALVPAIRGRRVHLVVRPYSERYWGFLVISESDRITSRVPNR